MTTALLLRASIDGAIAAGVIWLICRLVPSLPAGARAMLWWCAAAKFVVALLWTSPLPLPVLPASPGPVQTVAANQRSNVIPTSGGRIGAARPDKSSGEAAAMPWTNVPWPNVVLAIWAAGVAASLIVGVAQWRRARSIVRDAVPAPSDLHAMVAELAARAGLAQPPPACVSTRVTTPLVIGLRRSTIVLPAAIGAMTPSEQRMAVSHELAHIRRGDLRWGCVPALAEALFFFHPLAHVCAREYALWREAACDAAVIEATGAAPEDYAQLLLGLGVTRPRAGLAAAGASESFSNLKRRLVMLHTPASQSRFSRVIAAAMVGVAALAIVPVQLTARQAAPAASQTSPLTAATTAEVPKSAVFQTTPSPQQERRDREAAFSYQLRSKEGQPTFVIFRDDATHMMDGSREDLARARRFRQGQEPMIWVRQGGREYVSRDQTFLRQLHESWAPVASLARQQNEIGVQQNRISERQAGVSDQQSRISVEQSRLGVQQSEIGLRQSQLSVSSGTSATEQSRLEDERARLQAQISALSRQIEDLTLKMREMERPIRDLSTDMELQSREMARLSEQMQEASKRADAEIRTLIADAIASGVLQPVK